MDPNALRGILWAFGHAPKADIIRAVCEGVCYSLRNACDVLREMGLSITDMTACGGGASSVFLRQMLCDNYNIPVKTITSNQGGALGAAILGGVAGGAYSSVEQAVHACIAPKAQRAPNPQSHERYTQMYHQYNKLYPALKENFMALSHLEW